ncbi:MAG TPA: hypothetical protein VF004_03155 [Burkholderiales bacterium]
MTDFLAGGGEMGERMRALDWSRTPLGAPHTWPQSLRTALSIMLGSRYPMFLWWGASLVNFYNDGYIPVLGKRHPAALGANARELWAEIWDVVGPEAETVMQSGAATWNERGLLVMERNGFVEETYFSWSYSPARDESGAVAGVFCACTEERGACSPSEGCARCARSPRTRRARRPRARHAKRRCARWRRTGMTCRSRSSTSPTAPAAPVSPAPWATRARRT